MPRYNQEIRDVYAAVGVGGSEDFTADTQYQSIDREPAVPDSYVYESSKRRVQIG